MTVIRFECKPFEALSLEELYDLMVLRQQVFVVEQECAYLDADGLDQEALHILGRKESGDLVAYARILDKGKKYGNSTAMTRVVVNQEGRGVGIGRELVHYTLSRIKDEFGEGAVKISAQLYLKEFYTSFGFKTTSGEYLEDGIPHIEMILERE